MSIGRMTIHWEIHDNNGKIIYPYMRYVDGGQINLKDNPYIGLFLARLN